jgi:alkylation response protein AidB-like acyl-CoA dehydrogenase
VSVYGPEHDELRASVRTLLSRAADSAAVRATITGPEPFDRALWSRLTGELGLAGLAVAEQYGGSGYGVGELAVVLEEIGRANLPSPYLVTTLAGLALGLACPIGGAAAQDATDSGAAAEGIPAEGLAALLRGIAAGDQIVTVHLGPREVSAAGAVTARHRLHLGARRAPVLPASQGQRGPVR